MDSFVEKAIRTGDIPRLEYALKMGYAFCPTTAQDAGRYHQIRVLNWMRHKAMLGQFPFDPNLAVQGVIQPSIWTNKLEEKSRTLQSPQQGSKVLQFLTGNATIQKQLRFQPGQTMDNWSYLRLMEQVKQVPAGFVPLRSCL